MATQKVIFTSPTKEGEVPAYYLYASATTVAGDKQTVKISVISPESVTPASITGGNTTYDPNHQVLNGKFEVPQETYKVILEVDITDDSSYEDVDINVGEQHTATNGHITYTVITANDRSGGDNDFNDVVLIMYASADSRDNPLS